MSDKVNGAGYIDPGTCDIGREFLPRLCSLRHFAALNKPGYNPCKYCPLILGYLEKQKGEYETMKIAICKHCGEKKNMKAKGLCSRCYKDTEIREKYPHQYANKEDSGRDNNVVGNDEAIAASEIKENSEKRTHISDNLTINAPYTISGPHIIDGSGIIMRPSPECLTITHATEKAYQNAVSKGWHDTPRQPAELIALMHSELSEALEELRNGRPVQEIYYNRGSKKPEGVPVELADCVIRIMDFCGLHKIDLAEAITIKMDFNETRPRRHGGKAL